MFKYIAATAVALALATPALAEDGVDPEHIASLLKDAGYPADFNGEQTGYRQIVSKAGNYGFTVEFFDCTAGKACETLLFYTIFKKGDDTPVKEAIDAYSGEQPGGRMFLDRRGDPAIEYEFDLAEGLTDTQFTDSLKSWETMVANYAGFLAGRPAPAPAAPAAAAAPADSETPATS